MSIINKWNKMNNNIIYPNYKLNGLTIKLEKILSMVEKTEGDYKRIWTNKWYQLARKINREYAKTQSSMQKLHS